MGNIYIAKLIAPLKEIGRSEEGKHYIIVEREAESLSVAVEREGKSLVLDASWNLSRLKRRLSNG
jgi:hypothetical protein